MPNTVPQVWSDAVCPTHTLEHHAAMNRKKATHMAQKGNQKLGRTRELALGRWQVPGSGVACSVSVALVSVSRAQGN